MARDLEQLVLTMSADIRSMQRGLLRAEQDASRHMGAIQRKAEQTDRKLAQLGREAGAMFAPVSAGAGVATAAIAGMSVKAAASAQAVRSAFAVAFIIDAGATYVRSVDGSADRMRIESTGVTVAGELAVKGTQSLTGAWIPFTSTPSAITGAFGSASAGGRYRQIGKTIDFECEVNIVTQGTAAGELRLTAPVPAPNRNQPIHGYIYGGTGGGTDLTGVVFGSIIAVRKYDSTFPSGNNVTFVVAGTYEIA